MNGKEIAPMNPEFIPVLIKPQGTGMPVPYGLIFDKKIDIKLINQFSFL